MEKMSVLMVKSTIKVEKLKFVNKPTTGDDTQLILWLLSNNMWWNYYLFNF